MNGLKNLDYSAKRNDAILFIDDQEMVLDIGAQMLQRMGYCVLTASSGKQAIDLYQAYKNQIKLVILDIRMPDMDGKQTYLYLKGLNSKVKVLISTALQQDGTVAEMLACGCKGFIQKPYRMSELSAKIAEVLVQE